MDVDGLKVEMDRRFEAVDQRFEAVDRRFEAVDRRFEEVIALIGATAEDGRRDLLDQGRRLEHQIVEQGERLERQILEQGQRLEHQILAQGEQLRQEMREEGDRTRRFFAVAVEQMQSERNLVLDAALAADARTIRLTATNAADHVDFSTRLDDHEIRLTRLERKDES